MGISRVAGAPIQGALECHLCYKLVLLHLLIHSWTDDVFWIVFCAGSREVLWRLSIDFCCLLKSWHGNGVPSFVLIPL